MVPVGTIIELYYEHTGSIDSIIGGITSSILLLDTFCVRTFAYEDEAPMLSFPMPLPPDTVFLNCTNTVSPEPVPSAIDNCGLGNIILTTDTTDICGDQEYIVQRTWVVRDLSGNTDSLFQWVSVEDNFGPDFDVPMDTTINCDAGTLPADLGNPTNIMDDCQPLANIIISHTDLRDTFSCIDSIRINRTWKVEDACGNSQQRIQTIWLIDTIAPTFIVPMDTTLTCDATRTPAPVSYTHLTLPTICSV